MFIAELHLAHPDLALTHTIETVPEMEIELEYQTITDAGTYYLFFNVADGEFAEFETAVEADPTVTDATLILETVDFRIYRMELVATEHLVLPEAAKLGMRVLHSHSGDSGWISKIEVPDAALLQEFRNRCRQKDIEFTVRQIYQRHDEDDGGGGEYGLTPVQRETLISAHRAGYFSEPRDTSLQEIADQFGVSSSSASGRLRRAMATLVENTLLEED